ncbi:unnamed protein product [Cuscuta epithymum]|uniref:Uncharacterized protein n=1 Tax=Cuscuta epithymum TaxID=186058 RepID=A0AAV0DR78_9ASTE|nr:unnamed protein product [Cuscuta epithymum]
MCMNPTQLDARVQALLEATRALEVLAQGFHRLMPQEEMHKKSSHATPVDMETSSGPHEGKHTSTDGSHKDRSMCPDELTNHSNREGGPTNNTLHAKKRSILLTAPIDRVVQYGQNTIYHVTFHLC